jgi:hypothetical protein
MHALVLAGVLDAGSGELRKRRAPAVSEQTVAWLQTLPQPVRVAYEAGPTGMALPVPARRRASRVLSPLRRRSQG